MSENLKMLWSFALMLGLFAYFMQRGAKDLARLAGWLRNKAVAYAYELLNLHCEVCRLRRLQQWRRWFNRHPGIRSSRDITFLLLLMLVAVPAFATDWYYASASAGANNGTSCANAYAYNDGSNGWNVAGKQGADITSHACGTFTFSAGAGPVWTVTTSGTSGHPYTFKFETGAIIEAPYFHASTGSSACGGALCMNSKSNVVIDGGTNGILRNTDNGNALGNQQATLAVDMFACDTCTVQNLTIKNLYVRTSSADLATNPDVVNCIRVTGSHNKILTNTFDTVGWCVMDDFGNGDTDYEVAYNTWLHQAHGMMIASNSSFTISDVAIHDNWWKGSGTVWDGSGCPYHQSAIHMFGGAAATTVVDNLRIYNNRFDGDWGACPTGLVFQETGTGPINIHDQYYYNNVAIMTTAGQIENTNGWQNLGFTTGYTLRVINNTFYGDGAVNNGTPWVFNSAGTPGAVVFENNMIHSVGNPIYVQAAPSSLTSDYNIFDCNGFNCYVSPGPTFQNNLANWKTWCATLALHPACDANSTQNSSPGINSDGSLTVGSAARSAATNLSSLATGSNAALQNDTTYGNTRTALLRPSGSTAWDIGAYQYAAAPPPPASGLFIATMAMILLCLFLLPILKDPPVVEQQHKVEVYQWR